MNMRLFVLSLVTTAACAGALGAQTVPSAQEVLAPQAVRLALDARGSSLELEVRDLASGKAEAAIQEALHSVNELLLLVDPDSPYPGSLGELNRQTGQETALDIRVYRVLVRSLQFCVWSTGAFGPAGGYLYQLERGGPVPDGVNTAELAQGALCANVRLFGEKGGMGRVTLGGRTRLEIVGLVEGEALDLAFEVLKKHGVANAFGVFGPVRRAIGPGLSGAGWLADVPGVAGTRDPYDQLWLRDQSLALLRSDSPIQPINQRGGRPQPYLQIATVSTLAADAQALTHSLALLGFSEGQRRLGQLNPRPAVSWLLGGGRQPLESAYRWTLLSRPNNKLEVRN